ncbi:hypothetical protein BDR05DRAFT_966559 [Suillus weaverae]|nr:hypothetical protein BDR05DRAFT_966559 [Suillus weaverae]
MGWINDSRDDVPHVLWLSGPAGTGKSAITHTIVKWFSPLSRATWLTVIRDETSVSGCSPERKCAQDVVQQSSYGEAGSSEVLL